MAGRAGDESAGLFSVTKPAFGLVDGVLFAGEGTGRLDGTGFLRVVSQAGADGRPVAPVVSCRGRFEHDLRTGKGRLDCDNGETADFTFRFTGLTAGVGEGQSRGHGPIRFTFGLDAEDAVRALGLPAGTRIQAAGTSAAGEPAFQLEKVLPDTGEPPPGEPLAPLPSPASTAQIRGPASGASLRAPASTVPR